MIIKKAKYKKIKVWTNKQVSPDIHGCDECKKEIKDLQGEAVLEVRVFNNLENNTTHLHFCCWSCVFKYIPKIKSDYFVTLPYIHFDGNGKSRKELFSIIKKLKL